MPKFMDVLKYARESELEVQAELEQLDRLHEILSLPRRPASYRQGLTEKLEALEKRLCKSIDTALDRKYKALDLLETLSGDERTVLYNYYILGKDWLTIADEMFRSERGVYKLRKRAIDKLAKEGY